MQLSIPPQTLNSSLPSIVTHTHIATIHVISTLWPYKEAEKKVSLPLIHSLLFHPSLHFLISALLFLIELLSLIIIPFVSLFYCASSPWAICCNCVFPLQWFNMRSTKDLWRCWHYSLVSFIWLKLRRLICLSPLFRSFSTPPAFIHCTVAPTMTHLAYLRIYLTPKNKKRIIWTAINKTFSYSDMSCSCFPAPGSPLMLPIWECLSGNCLMPNWAKAS